MTPGILYNSIQDPSLEKPSWSPSWITAWDPPFSLSAFVLIDPEVFIGDLMPAQYKTSSSMTAGAGAALAPHSLPNTWNNLGTNPAHGGTRGNVPVPQRCIPSETGLDQERNISGQPFQEGHS